jgi:hypothetical protein
MDLIDRLLPGLQEKARQLGYDALSHAERVVLDVTAVEADVNNGGFHQFFYNSTGDRVVQSIAALHEIGAHATAAIVEEACARFPKGEPDPKWFARQKQLLDKLSFEEFYDLDKRFFEYPDDTSGFLIAYWLKNGGPTD